MYVTYGPFAGTRSLEDDADATLVGDTPGLAAGRIVDAGADLDGDGVGDVVASCVGDLGAPASGGFFVVYGPVAGAMSLDDALEIVAGAPHEGTGGAGAGAVYVVDLPE